MTTKPIPDGFHSVTPFLNVKGAAEAIELYKKALGAEERSRISGPNGTVMHAVLQIGDSLIMMGDAIQNPPTLSSLHLYLADVDAALQRATAAGMTVKMPLADQFWGDRYCIVEDKFGNRWGLATHKEDVSPEEMQKRATALMKP